MHGFLGEMEMNKLQLPKESCSNCMLIFVSTAADGTQTDLLTPAAHTHTGY